jgi:hypothetical protein
LCDRGLFELKYFFGSGVASTDGDGDGAAAEAVKAAIREIIEGEEEILSDDAIAALLKQRGFDIARRTVVKYRESMGIGSSVQRRQAAQDRRPRLEGEPRPDGKVIRRPPGGFAHVHARRIDTNVGTDDDPVERSERMARVEARSRRRDPELGGKSFRQPPATRHSLVSPIRSSASSGAFRSSRMARICRRRQSPDKSRCIPTTRSGRSPGSSNSASTAPRGSNVGSSERRAVEDSTSRFTSSALPCQPMLLRIDLEQPLRLLTRLFERALVAMPSGTGL